MSDHRESAMVVAAAAVLNATVAGMVAHNQLNGVTGKHPFYNEADFERVINQSGCHPNAVIETLRGY